MSPSFFTMLWVARELLDVVKSLVVISQVAIERLRKAEEAIEDEDPRRALPILGFSA
jgi:hypothetical protein